MKKMLSAILIAVILLLSLVSCDDYGVLYTESIEDYNTEKYSLLGYSNELGGTPAFTLIVATRAFAKG